MRDGAGLDGAHDGEVLLQLHLPVVVRVDLPQDAGIMKAFMSSCHRLQERVLAFLPTRNNECVLYLLRQLVSWNVLSRLLED